MTSLQTAARAQATNALTVELARREDMRRSESIRIFNHPGASISRTFMSREEQWAFLLDAYDAALASEKS